MKNAKIIVSIIILLSIVGIFSCESPQTPVDTYDVTVSGTLYRKSGSPLDSAIVTLFNPFMKDTTGTDGTFNFSFTSREKNDVATSMIILRTDFYDTTFSVTYGSESNAVSFGEIFMRGLTAAVDSVVTGKTSTRAVTLQHISSSASSISIKGAGGVDYASIIFEARDSLGVPVDKDNVTKIHFRLVEKPDALTSLNIDSINTNSNGKATVIVYAGQKSGIAQVRAFTTMKNSTDTTKIDTVRSQIVSIPIYGGYPDSNHITISSSRVNLPAGSSSAVGIISALIGDKFGNPVQAGTPVYFETNGGIVSPGSMTTDETGGLSVTLTPTNPMPPAGIATVIASIGSGALGANTLTHRLVSPISKYDKSDGNDSRRLSKTASVLTTSVDVLFSGPSVITTTDNNFVLPSKGATNVRFTVSDELGNPLSSGSRISVTGIGMDSIGVILNGDVSVDIPDTRDRSWTSFSVGITDLGTGSWTDGTKVGLSVNVQSPNGNKKQTITGYLGQAPIDTTGQPPTARQPSQIAYVSSSSSSIFVSGVGGTETAAITYEVRDSLGVPIDLSRRALVTFTLQFFPNSLTGGGTAPVLLPRSDSTDSQGRVRVTVVSGTQAGVIQVISTLSLPSKTITSQPVKISVNAGFADQNHFTIAAPNYNFPGLQKAFSPTLVVTVGVTDKYSNPVIPGTQVYFHTAHGTITAGGGTNANGFASGTLNPGNPYPPTGYSKVYAQTIGMNGQPITDSITVLWTGAPIITNTGSTTFTTPNGGISGALTFSVADFNGNPMSAGTQIVVESSVGEVIGASETTMFDTFSIGEGTTTFTVYMKDADPADVDPAESGDVKVTVNHPIYGSYKLVLATGTVD
ncbi:MAG: Ig-like domain-containing protein [Bacteroidota bacterium]